MKLKLNNYEIDLVQTKPENSLMLEYDNTQYYAPLSNVSSNDNVLKVQLTDGTIKYLTATGVVPNQEPENNNPVNEEPSNDPVQDPVDEPSNKPAKEPVNNEPEQPEEPANDEPTTKSYNWKTYIIMPRNTKAIPYNMFLDGTALESIDTDPVYGPNADGEGRNLEVRFIGTTTQAADYTYNSAGYITGGTIIQDEELGTNIDESLITFATDSNGILIPFNELPGADNQSEYEVKFNNKLETLGFGTAGSGDYTVHDGIIPDDDAEDGQLEFGTKFQRNSVILVAYNSDGVSDSTCTDWN